MVGPGLSVPKAAPGPSPSIGDNMQSFTEDPYVTDEKFREKGTMILSKVLLHFNGNLCLKN